MAVTSPIIESLENKSLKTDLPKFRPGDTVAVHYKIVEGDKLRVQVFRGTVIKVNRAGVRSTRACRRSHVVRSPPYSDPGGGQ